MILRRKESWLPQVNRGSAAGRWGDCFTVQPLLLYLLPLTDGTFAPRYGVLYQSMHLEFLNVLKS